MKCIVEILGQPQDHLLNAGMYTHNFFIKVEGENEQTWRLMVELPVSNLFEMSNFTWTLLKCFSFVRLDVRGI